ncbi:MAG: 16S rRNA processing protein RimM [Desulfobulbaceae bacterium]|nr:16S rRNA processing protein RimM [Desulfobulbaceae bacterium]
MAKAADQSSPAEPAFVRIGRVLRPHGLQGEIRVETYTARRENFLAFTRIFLASQDETKKKEYWVAKARLSGTALVLALADIDGIDAAELLRNQVIWLDSNDLPRLAPDEFYLHTLMGKEASTDDGIPLGRICAVLDTGAPPVLVLRHNTREFLIPAVAAFISQIGTDAVVFSLPQGLLEINAEP